MLPSTPAETLVHQLLSKISFLIMFGVHNPWQIWQRSIFMLSLLLYSLAQAQEDAPPQTDQSTQDKTSSEVLPEAPSNRGVYSDVPDLLNASSEATQTWINLVDTAIKKHELSQLIPVLKSKIRAAAPNIISADRFNYTACKTSKIFLPSLDLCLLTDLLGTMDPQELLAPAWQDPNKEDLSPDAFISWLLQGNGRVLHRLLQNFELNSGTSSQVPYTLTVFYTIWQLTPVKERMRYLNLAIACSLVRKEVAEQGSMLRRCTEPLLSITELYNYFREADKKRNLLTDIKKLSPSDLLYVVQLRLPQSEIDYVQKKMRFRRDNWGDAYASIEYMMERATQNSDPYKKYTFDEIKKLGGVCRDQAYYAACTARCKGIPAVIIVGDGDRGLHAWVGLLSSDKGWTTTGSYGYNTGRYLNPCSGFYQHESTLLDSNNRLSGDKLSMAADGIMLSIYLGHIDCKEQALAAAKFVTSNFPLLTAAWHNRIRMMEQFGDELVTDKDWKKVYSELSRLYKKNSELIDLAQNIQTSKLMEGKSDLARKSALKKDTRKISMFVDTGRMDLLSEALRRQAEIPARSGNGKELASFFKALIKQYASRADVLVTILDTYKATLQEYAETIQGNEKLNEKKQTALVQSAWRTAAKDAMAYYGKHAYETDDYFAIKKAHEVMFKIAEFWRMSGDEDRADEIEDEAERKLKASKGGI